MADKTDYYRNLLQAHNRGGTVLAQPAQLYLALSIGDPGSDLAGLTEPPGANGYARQPVTLEDVGGGVNGNDALVRFGPVTNADWVGVSHAVFMDAVTGGNGWVVDALTGGAVTVSVGNPLDIEAGKATWDEQ